MDSPACTSCAWHRALAWLVAVVALASAAMAVFQTRTEWFREMDVRGTWHVVVWDGTTVLLPAAILLFALGVQWALRRRAVLAAPALVPLPAWVACLLLTDNLLANDCWFAIVGLQMQGISPFGAP